MKNLRHLFALALLALLFAPSGLFGQEQTATPGVRGSVDLGVRGVTGDVYGRPDLPFKPDLFTSKYNEYRDIKNGFFLRGLDAEFSNFFGTKDYLNIQSRSAVYKDQSYLVTFGEYGRFKIQFRYDEIPHIISNTTRTIYAQPSPGVFTIAPAFRSTLQAATAATLPATALAQVSSFPFTTPAVYRKSGGGLVSFDVTENWTLLGSFTRENMVGSRPIGLILNSSPSASATAGFGAELPEPIDYFTNTVKVGTEYGRKSWAVQAAYIGSFFENNIASLTFDNPFRATAETQANPLTGRMALYPSNQAHNIDFAGAFDLTKYLHVVGAISPGWMRQNEPFLPYTTNSAINSCGTGTQACSSTAVLPVNSLNGQKQTLAMNYVFTSDPFKNVELKAAYRHYDYNNNTAVHNFTPVEGDVSVPSLTSPVENKPFGYNKKNVEVTGSWFFAKRSSLKLGYEGELMDRKERDVEHSIEHSLISAIDYSPKKDLNFHVAFRHQERTPDAYADEEVETSFVPNSFNGFALGEQRFHRRFDEAARTRDRGDASFDYSPTDRLSFYGSFSTVQDNYNKQGGVNSAVALNYLTGAAATTNPYYLYGLLNDLTYNYVVGGTFDLTSAVSWFGEYSYELYHKRMTSRARTPESAPATPPAQASRNGCGPNSLGVSDLGACDSNNDDWESTARDRADVWSTGFDFNVGKKITITTYYSLAAGKGHIFTRALGTQPATFLTNPAPLANDPNRFALTTTSAAVDYPETVNRSHEVGAVVKFKMTKNITPRFEYRYQQFDNKDFQTSAMTPYMGCIATSGVTGIPTVAATVATGCPVVGPTSASSLASPYYPYFVVGDASAARFYFLGTDQPSYRAHYFAATIQYSF